MLDQVGADERRAARMVDQDVHRVADIVQTGAAGVVREGRQRGAEEVLLRHAIDREGNGVARVVAAFDHPHRRHRVSPLPGRAGLEVEPGEDAGELLDVVAIVGGDRLAVDVELAGAVHVQLPQADREQLHDLAGEVFVRHPVDRRVGLAVADVAQIPAHPRVDGDFVKQRPVAAERVADHGVVPVRRGDAVAVALRPDHHDLAERPGDPLAEFVRREQGLPHPDRVHVLAIHREAGLRRDEVREDRVVRRGGIARHAGGQHVDVGAQEARRDRELLVDPLPVGVRAQRLHRGDLRHRRAES